MTTPSRWIPALALSLAALLATASPARGQAVPVFDPANYALEAVHNALQDDVTERALAKVAAYYVAIRRAGDLYWRGAGADLETMRALAEVGDGFGYGQSDLLAVFDASFPGLARYGSDAAAARRAVLERELQAAENQLRVLRAHSRAIDDARSRLGGIRSTIETGGLQATYDMLLASGVFEAEEYQLLRQILASDLTVTLVQGAAAANERGQQMRAIREALGRP